MKPLALLSGAVAAGALALLTVPAEEAGAAAAPDRSGGAFVEPSYEKMREFLPDYSEGTTGILGPFVWSRALDLGEDVRFADASGAPDKTGEFLWFYQFNRNKRAKGLKDFLHARNNLVAADGDLAFAVQPWHFLHHTSGPHNSKLIFGYVQKDAPFQHGDNCDLAHLANGDRVVVFFPVRKDAGTDGSDQGVYYVNPHYAAQTPCVMEFRKGEMIHYEHFRDPRNLAPRILLDLQPVFSGEKKLNPATSRPVLRFVVDGKGGWKLQIRRDGAKGGADGGAGRAAEYDHVFTHESPGAKKYTVDVTAENSAWAMSVFSPGGSPTESSEVVVKLMPHSRKTGEPVPWPERSVRVRDVPLDKLGQVLANPKSAPRK